MATRKQLEENIMLWKRHLVNAKSAQHKTLCRMFIRDNYVKLKRLGRLSARKLRAAERKRNKISLNGAAGVAT
jgi:hypothetical protein